MFFGLIFTTFFIIHIQQITNLMPIIHKKIFLDKINKGRNLKLINQLFLVTLRQKFDENFLSFETKNFSILEPKDTKNALADIQESLAG